MEFNIDNRLIGSSNPCFIIAEIGQNHQGDISIAKQMIAEAKKCGADCVKFQKSCLEEKFTEKALQRPYTSSNSWGQTYGEHKKYLEFTIDQYIELQQYAHSQDILFSASAMDPKSLEHLYTLNVPFIKIGSGDTNNFPLLQSAAKLNTPLIISTGMQAEETIVRIVRIMAENKKSNYCLMHCVSAYPTKPENVGLRMIEKYEKLFPNICLGYSGHEEGLAISAAAICLGAKVLERHFTLDRHQKGTDHPLSLEPNEFTKLIKIIREIETEKSTTTESIVNRLRGFNFDSNELDNVKKSLEIVSEKTILLCEMDCRNKLGKSLVYSGNLLKGMHIQEKHICVKVTEPQGISADQYFDVIGKTLLKDVKYEDLIQYNDLNGF